LAIADHQDDDNDHLRGKWKVFPSRMVDKLVHTELAEDPLGEGLLADPVANLIGLGQRVFEQVVLLRYWFEFDASDEEHMFYFATGS
jgi:hypothetical protein